MQPRFYLRRYGHHIGKPIPRHAETKRRQGGNRGELRLPGRSRQVAFSDRNAAPILFAALWASHWQTYSPTRRNETAARRQSWRATTTGTKPASCFFKSAALNRKTSSDADRTQRSRTAGFGKRLACGA